MLREFLTNPIELFYIEVLKQDKHVVEPWTPVKQVLWEIAKKMFPFKLDFGVPPNVLRC